MAIKFRDRVAQLSTTTGTESLKFSDTVLGHQTFATAYDEGDELYYAVEDEATGDWEIGLGLYTSLDGYTVPGQQPFLTATWQNYQIAVSPDSRYVAVAAGWDYNTTFGQLARVFDSQNDYAEITTTIPNAGDFCEGVAFSPDGAFLFVSRGENFGEVFKVQTSDWTVVAAPTISFSAQPETLATSPNGSWVAISTSIGDVVVMDYDGNVVATLVEPAGSGDITFSPDSSLLAVTSASSSSDQPLWVFETSGWTVVPGVSVTAEIGNTCGFSPDGTKLAVGVNSTPGLVVYNTSDWTVVTTPSTSTDVDALVFSPDGTELWAACVTRFGIMDVIETTGWTITQQVYLPDITPEDVVFSPDGNNVYTVDSNRFQSPSLLVINANTYDDAFPPLVRTYPEINSARFSPNGTYFATGGFNSATFQFVTDAQTGGVVFRTDAGDFSSVNAVGFTADETKVIFAGNTLGIYTIATGVLDPNTPTLTGTGREVQTSPDGTMVAIGMGASPYVRVYDPTDWSILNTPTVSGNFNGAEYMSFSPDNAYLAMATHVSPYLYVVSTSDWSTVTVPAMAGSPEGLQFTPDGTKLVYLNQSANTIVVIETTGWTVENTFTTGGPDDALAITPDSQYALVLGFVNFSKISLADGTIEVSDNVIETNSLSGFAISSLDEDLVVVTNYNYPWSVPFSISTLSVHVPESGERITRAATPVSSSNAGASVSLAVGEKRVFSTLPASVVQALFDAP